MSKRRRINNNIEILSVASDNDERNNNDQDDDAGDLVFSQIPASQQPTNNSKENASSSRNNKPNLDDRQKQDILNRLVRYLVSKGSKNDPVKYIDLDADVFKNYKGVTRYFLDQADKILLDTFGMKMVLLDEKYFKGVYSKGRKQTYFIINAFESDVQRSVQNNPAKDALLLITLSILWCAPEQKMSERTLWDHLHAMDDEISLEKKNSNHRLLGDIARSLKDFETQMFIMSSFELDENNVKQKMISLGPRTIAEIGNKSLFSFVFQVKDGKPPDEKLTDEIDDLL